MQRQGDVRLAAHWGATAVIVALVLATLTTQQSGPSPNPTDPVDPDPTCTGAPVALTFDDGPSRDHSTRLADILARNNVRATFFMTGRSVTARPGRARRFARDGHRIYNHTYDHVDLTASTDEEIRDQIASTRRALRNADVPSDGHLVRPPYGRIDGRVRRVLRDLGYRSVTWTVDTDDWKGARTAAQIHAAVADGLAPRANILLHDNEHSQATLRALPRIIRTVRDRGYCFGVVDDRGRVVRPDGT